MILGTLVFSACIWTAFCIETTERKLEIVEANFKILKTVTGTEVFYLTPSRRQNCTSINGNHSIINIIHNISSLSKTDNGKNEFRAGDNSTYFVCGGKMHKVNVGLDVITLEPDGNCQFSKKYCDFDGVRTFWNSSLTWKTIYEGKVEIWKLSRFWPRIKLLVVKNGNEKFILQLLSKFKMGNQEIWYTDINGIHAVEFQTTADGLNLHDPEINLLNSFLKHSNFSNMKSGVTLCSPAPKRSFSFYIFILVIVSVALFILTRVCGVLVNCFILSETGVRNCGLCCKPFSRNLTNYHVMKYYSIGQPLLDKYDRSHVDFDGIGRNSRLYDRYVVGMRSPRKETLPNDVYHEHHEDLRVSGKNIHQERYYDTVPMN
ncbi:hypothetical protein JTB14_019701 [Gonioctena quinquepunctata]|nr:hypothetical protein JTB14_019701 [Gonioctena quinquepunctata]